MKKLMSISVLKEDPCAENGGFGGGGFIQVYGKVTLVDQCIKKLGNLTTDCESDTNAWNKAIEKSLIVA